MQRTSRLLRRAIAQARPYSSLSRAPVHSCNNLLRISPVRSPFQQPSNLHKRFASELSVPKSQEADEATRPEVPSYQLTFTCKPCGHRAPHRVTKQAFHHGTVLITCPQCKSRHVLADHLKIFMDEASSLEDILKRNAGGEKDLSKLLKKGRLGQREGQLVANEGEGNLEFWDDGSVTQHKPS